MHVFNRIDLESALGTWEHWLAFSLFVVIMLCLDLFLFHRGARQISKREAILWSLFWIALAFIFAGLIWYFYGFDTSMVFMAGYLIEKSLSVDNLFIFIVIFSYFAVPEAMQHRVLFWGIIGALIMRAIFIILGAIVIQKFHWVLYLLGILIFYTGIKLIRKQPENFTAKNLFLLKYIKKLIPLTNYYSGSAFFVKLDGRWLATPLLVVLLTIEASDFIFALDSIPAVFAITTEPFIIFTSNIFALFGLRSLFFVFSGALTRFRYLRFGLGLILIFVGIKMLISDLIEIPIAISLSVILIILFACFVASQKNRAR